MSVAYEKTRPFTASGAIGNFRAVKLAGATTVAEAGLGEDGSVIGYVEEGQADGETVKVTLAGERTVRLTASAAIAAAAAVAVAADGKIVTDASGSSKALGVALQAASGDGSIIEVLLLPRGGEAGDILTAGEALAANRLVRPDTGGEAVYADAAEYGLAVGVTTAAADNGAPVSMLPASGIREIETTAAAIAIGDDVKCAADGKVVKHGTTSTEPVIGKCLTTISGSGGVASIQLYRATVTVNHS